MLDNTWLLKVDDLCNIFGVSYWTILRWARQGQFGAFKQGKSWYFPKEKVEEALRIRPNAAPPMPEWSKTTTPF
jgi:excisionase family DNA binding protein